MNTNVPKHSDSLKEFCVAFAALGNFHFVFNFYF